MMRWATFEIPPTEKPFFAGFGRFAADGTVLQTPTVLKTKRLESSWLMPNGTSVLLLR